MSQRSPIGSPHENVPRLAGPCPIAGKSIPLAPCSRPVGPIRWPVVHVDLLREYADMTQHWKYPSPDTAGLHEVISPDNSDCKITWIYRLNLPAGEQQPLHWPDREANLAVIDGRASVTVDGRTEPLGRLDSLYLPGDTQATVSADEELTAYVGAGPWDGVGELLVRRYDPDWPLGEVRQVHGRPPFRRDVFMTLNQEQPASRLICGFTWGDDGGWTSWPPHQHTKDLEEVYCYFDLPTPAFALHLGYRNPGELETVHPVSTGDCVVIPEGYHPTVAMPGARSCYFWVMVAHSQARRRYDLAIDDPTFSD